MNSNMLKLNDGKTDFIVFSFRHNSHLVDTSFITVGTTDVEAAASVRKLGAQFDTVMSMESFVNDKIKTCLYYLGCISRIRKYLTVDATKYLVHAYIISRLDYANSLLFGINKSLINRLQVIQNSAARLIFNCPRSAHATPLLNALHWLPVEKRIMFKVATVIFKCLNGSAPSYLTELIQVHRPIRNLRSRGGNLLVKNRCNNSFGDRAFSNFAPVLWNNLPASVRCIKSLDVFRNKLKTHLFNL